MKTSDRDIKKALQDNLKRIEDKSFTDKVVSNHLANRKIIKSLTFINFLPMIIGLSIVIINIGLIILVKQNNVWIKEVGITENNGLIILIMTIIFLIYKLMEEITAPNKKYSAFGRKW